MYIWRHVFCLNDYSIVLGTAAVATPTRISPYGGVQFRKYMGFWDFWLARSGKLLPQIQDRCVPQIHFRQKLTKDFVSKNIVVYLKSIFRQKTVCRHSLTNIKYQMIFRVNWLGKLFIGNNSLYRDVGLRYRSKLDTAKKYSIWLILYSLFWNCDTSGISGVKTKYAPPYTYISHNDL